MRDRHQQRDLPQGRVDVWQIASDALPADEAERLLPQLLSEVEQGRWRRLALQRDRHIFLLAHVMVRRALEHYYGIACRDWKFSIGPNGKPELAGPIETRLHFNLTHTRELALCAMTMQGAIGIDVEPDSAGPRAAELDERVFAPSERELLRVLPSAKRAETALALWTVKEAVAKGTGLGMQVRFSEIVVEKEAGAGLRFRADGGSPLVAADWTLRQLRVGRSFIGAVAVQAPPSQALGVRVVAIEGSALDIRELAVEAVDGIVWVW